MTYQHGTPKDGATYGEAPEPPKTWFLDGQTYGIEARDHVVAGRYQEAIKAAENAIARLAWSIEHLAAEESPENGVTMILIQDGPSPCDVTAIAPALPGVRHCSASTLPDALRELAREIEQFHTGQPASSNP